jgi:hypothetical protein
MNKEKNIQEYTRPFCTTKKEYRTKHYQSTGNYPLTNLHRSMAFFKSTPIFILFGLCEIGGVSRLDFA